MDFQQPHSADGGDSWNVVLRQAERYLARSLSDVPCGVLPWEIERTAVAFVQAWAGDRRRLQRLIADLARAIQDEPNWKLLAAAGEAAAGGREWSESSATDPAAALDLPGRAEERPLALFLVWASDDDFSRLDALVWSLWERSLDDADPAAAAAAAFVQWQRTAAAEAIALHRPPRIVFQN